MENFISVDWDFVETIVASATRFKKLLPHFVLKNLNYALNSKTK